MNAYEISNNILYNIILISSNVHDVYHQSVVQRLLAILWTLFYFVSKIPAVNGPEVSDR